MKLFQIPILLLLAFFFLVSSVYADEFEDRAGVLDARYTILAQEANSGSDETKQAIAGVKALMVNRQLDVINAYTSVKARVDALIAADPKKSDANTLLENAKDPVASFMNLNVDSQIDQDTIEPKGNFNTKESEALNKITKINTHLLSPSRPGQVPKGDLLEDFIPGIIRILFRFASLAVLVSFVVSGVMFVMAFSNDERISKAKSMLYYSLIGFAFVTLAFAIIKAVTDIDFFGFI